MFNFALAKRPTPPARRRVRFALPILISFLAVGGSPAFAQSRVNVAWDPVAGADISGYKVYYGKVSGAYTSVVSVGNRTNTTVAGLNFGTKYYFAATAVNVYGLESSYSAETVYTTPVPEVLRINLNPSRQARLTGTGPAGFRYEVLATANLATWTVIGSVTNDAAGTFQFTDPTSATQKLRCYRLRQVSP